MSKKIAVLLSGCGHRDGAEVHEATCTLLALDQAGVEIIGIAPNRDQSQVTNHINSEKTNDTRNIMIESARILRGNVKPVPDITADEIDALILPGGFGAALNLCNYAQCGSDCEIDSDVKKLITDCLDKGKPIGAICIAPIVVARALRDSGREVTLTIGNDKNVAADIESLGSHHKSCAVDDVVIDAANKIVTTPAYMLGTRISQVNAGIKKLVEEVLKLT